MLYLDLILPLSVGISALGFYLGRQYQKHQSSRHLLRRTFEASPFAVYIFDPQKMTFLAANSRCQSVIGFNETQLRSFGEKAWSTMLPNQSDSLQEHYQSILQKPIGEITERHETFMIGGSTPVQIEFRETPFYFRDGDSVKILGFARDVTPETKVKKDLWQERLRLVHLEKYKALGEIASGVAHEINNPLAIILGRVDLIRNKMQRAQQEPAIILENLQKIDESVRRISDIVRNLRRLSNHSGAEELILFPIERVLEDLSHIWTAKLQVLGIRFVMIQTDRGLNDRSLVEGRPTQILQALSNLVSNSQAAVQGLEERWIEVSFQTTEDRVKIFVTDSGPGLSRTVADRMFDPFFTTMPVGQGTGLGLPVSMGIIRDHHGEISYNTISEKTQFVIDLPLSKIDRLAS